MSDTNAVWPSPQPDSLGQIVGADDIRDAVKATILEWSPYYIAILTQRLAESGRFDGVLPQFGQWVNRSQYRSAGTGQPASFISTVLATVGTPDVQGSGHVQAVFRSQVVIQVYGTSWEEAADRLSWYEKVVRWCILQHKSLGRPDVSAVKWTGTQFSGEEFEHASTRTLAQAVVAFNVSMMNVIEVNRGPLTVPHPPLAPSDYTVETVEMDLTIVPVTEPL